MLRKSIRGIVRRARRWLEEAAEDSAGDTAGQIDARYPRALFAALVREMSMSRRAHYVWGVMQGARLARVLAVPRVSVIEFGVAGGNGLVALERIAARVESVYGVGIDVYGFDMGCGLPKPVDHRDLPNLFSEGDYPMDVGALRQRLSRARLMLGPVGDTVSEFVESNAAPVCFVANDLDLYSSTMDSFKLLEGSSRHLLPRIHCYFDDILGLTYGDCNGERLAIADFNARHARRQFSPIYGLKYFVPGQFAASPWTEKFYLAHILDHPAYGDRDLVIERRRDLQP